MTSRKPAVVREPVQVYLAGEDRDRLSRLTERLATTKSEALRRGLEALERELTDPSGHPALRVVGLVQEEGVAAEPDLDAAREHDRVIADEAAAGSREA